MDYVEANVGIRPTVEYSPFAKDDSCGLLCVMVRFDETLLKECHFCYNLLKKGDPGDDVDVCPLHLRRYENHYLKESMSLQKFSCTHMCEQHCFSGGATRIVNLKEEDATKEQYHHLYKNASTHESLFEGEPIHLKKLKVDNE